jgi:UDP-N-acetylmuramate--L-alanine ligase
MRIYFSGIGGVGIGPLAEIALDAGYSVYGSDREPSVMTRSLQNRGVNISFDQSGDFLQTEHKKSPFDWFVYTSALPDNHPELTLAKQLGIKTGKRDELIAKIISDKNLKLIAIAGTHGKTTTTGMLVWTFHQLNIPVSYSIGSTIQFGPSGRFDKDSQFFVYECDEFDKNFLHFYPWLSIITSIDYDHPDTYPSKIDYTNAFRQFINQSKHCIMYKDDFDNLNIKDTVLDLIDKNEHKNKINSINLAGDHNRENAYLILTELENMGIQTDKAQLAIESFPGTGRRFEKIADNLYSDYGHHPIEIAATLQMAKELNDRVVLVYQPHQNIRQHEIIDQYTNCMDKADTIYWLPTYLTREDPKLEILTPQALTKNLINKSSLEFAELDNNLWDKIKAERKNGKLVLCMGAGTIDGWLRAKISKD